ncbi:helix-turn-helix domain-containing protein [Lelliottia wanjuensis]|uniref:helix-turn-helix domain-containing protein n=1 Tax=Lelliottia wanjuensis TaxID=3050585 RepID=UPI002551BF51|nr:helix-turn-helix domain-containing protein [Lelliottia sp. V86_10]MDK9586404.1 helix-turn-helix domain-containing protein [Lelliottia sp. V86_10]
MKSALHNCVSVYQDPCFNLEKPVAEVERIIEKLLPAATPVFMQEGGGVINLKLLNKNKGGLSVILLLKGKMNFIRKSSGGILFGTAEGPSVFGLLGSSFKEEVFKYVAVGDCNIYALPRDMAIDIINNHNLLRDVLNYHAYISDMEVRYSNRLINQTPYGIVCAILCELAALPESIRLKTGIAKFIIERSHISRSTMMKILADLRDGGYVDIQYGKLIRIIKNFPKFY